ncbi:MAG: 30S ribosomal protein S16 [Candidatus Improbicoccus devescovinae]|nr:MAG: 30S ribosomal protein S16 [Candidatus Improbicoccus devescovinae]
MAVKIRLRRLGSHKKPFYRVVVADSRSPRDGKFIEEIGYHDPILKEKNSKFDLEKAKKWIACGAQPTQVVRSIMNKKLREFEQNSNTN